MGVDQHAPFRIHGRWLACLFGALLPGVLGGALALDGETAVRLAIVFPERGPYRESADALAGRCRAAGYGVEVFPVAGLDDAQRRATLLQVRDYRPTVIATGGATMTAEAQSAFPNVPAVYFMVPNALDAPFSSGSSGLPGVTADVAPEQQVDWIKKSASKCHRVALLHGARTKHTAQSLETTGTARGLHITLIEASSEKFAAAIDTLNKGDYDGVLMIADSDVYDSANVQTLLLWGVRNNRCVWTFSENVVKAGAFASISVDTGAVGADAAAIVRSLVDAKSPKSTGMRYPTNVRRVINVHTAALIGMDISQFKGDTTIVRLGAPE